MPFKDDYDFAFQYISLTKESYAFHSEEEFNKQPRIKVALLISFRNVRSNIVANSVLCFCYILSMKPSFAYKCISPML